MYAELGSTERIPVDIGPLRLKGLLRLPSASQGIVILAHGSGSGRLSPRNNFVAERFHQADFATLLLDLLIDVEERDRRRVFDVALLARRLLLASEWACNDARTRGMPIGYFGASTGAGATLYAASTFASEIKAVVARGGRPDLAGAALDGVRAPTLLIVGSRDTDVIELNRLALARLKPPKKLVLIEGANHLFEEPGSIDQVIAHALTWFERYIGGRVDAA